MCSCVTLQAAVHLGQDKKEENLIVARGVGATSVQAGLGQATCQGRLAGISKITVRYLGSRLTWNMSFAKERETRTAPALECVANVGRFLECASQRQLKKCMFNATVQGAILSGLFAFAGPNGSFTENGLFPLKVCRNRLAHRLLAMTRRTWDSEPKQVTNHEQKKCTERLEWCQLQRSSKFVEWAGQRAVKDFANLQIHPLNYGTKSKLHVLTTINSKNKKWDLLENSQKYALKLF